jgi:hypothetical protein
LLPIEAASVRERSSVRLSPVRVAAALLGLTLVAWILTFDQMRGMGAGPGSDLGGLGWFLGMRQQAIYVPTWILLLGFLAAWTAYGSSP